MNFQHQHHPKEIFCGNLSLFCVENDLLQVFNEYAKVRAVRIIRNQERTKSLMYAFIRFETVSEAEEMARLFHGQLFQGRKLRTSHPSFSPMLPTVENQYPIPVYLSIIAEQNLTSSDETKSVVTVNKPTETMLRKFFLAFGPIDDVTVREFELNEDSQRYEGYGFITFVDNSSGFRLASINDPFHCNGFIISASMSNRVSQMNPLHEISHINYCQSISSPPMGIRNMMTSPQPQYSVSQVYSPPLSNPWQTSSTALPRTNVPSSTTQERAMVNMENMALFLSAQAQYVGSLL